MSTGIVSLSIIRSSSFNNSAVATDASKIISLSIKKAENIFNFPIPPNFVKINPRNYPQPQKYNYIFGEIPYRSAANDPRYLCHIISEANIIFDKDMFVFDYIIPDKIYRNKENFELGCAKCGYIWRTDNEILLYKKVGCSWCKDKCKYMGNITFRMIAFISGKRLEKEYFFYIDPTKEIYTSKDELLLWCGNDMHSPFYEKVKKVLSGSKTSSQRTKGCPKCKEELPPKVKIIWKNNYTAVVKQSNEKHGKDTYSYHLTDPASLENNRSILTIVCNQVNDDAEICTNIFTQPITDHLDGNRGCPKCNGNHKYNLASFLSKAKEKYPNGEFLYRHIKEEDIKNNKSKINIECSDCEFIMKDVLLSDFMMGRKKCDRCINKEKWTAERLKSKCEEREKEGEYVYDLIKWEEIEDKKIPIICVKCRNDDLLEDEYVFYQNFYRHFNDHSGCRRCANNLPWRDRIERACEIKAKEGKYCYDLIDYDLIENEFTEVPIICLDCKKDNYNNYVFTQKICLHFQREHGCPKCGKSAPWNYETFFEQLERLPSSFTDNYSYDQIEPEMFVKGGTKIPINCKICSKITNILPTHHVALMRGCSFCCKSEGSKMVQTYLENNGIPFQDEVPCSGLNGYDYRYDYEIVYAGQKIILEYDGKNHFCFNKYMHKNLENFEAARLRDVYKHWLALQNGYRIIRIDDLISHSTIDYHIRQGLNSSSKEYFSTPTLYEKLIESVKNFTLPVK
jgi:hypothetical protein